MEEQSIYTLAECVDEYMAIRQINKKKYYASYLICAKNYWKQLFRNTIYAVSSQWVTLKKGVPYNYLDIPKGCVRLFSVSTIDECNKIIPLFYDDHINVITKPSTATSQKKCNCSACDCGGLCDDIGSLTYTTKVLFSINGIDYIEKTWIKVCPNGDVIEYRTVPVKKYNSFAGDGGDYSTAYMNDFDIGDPPFADYTIEYLNLQKVICKLETKVCGCPENTPENFTLLNDFCGCFLPFNAHCKRKHCGNFLGEINGNNRNGTVKISECGTKIYYIPPDNRSKNFTLPISLLINWQTSGENCTDVVQVPEYAIETMWYGIDDYSKRFNNSYSLSEKAEAKYARRNSENELVLFLNQISLEWLSTVQDSPIRY